MSRFQFDSRLTTIERLVLRTCCYPPAPGRTQEAGAEQASARAPDIERHHAIYSRAFGDDLWSEIRGRDVLDIGCGYGGFVLALADAGARTAVGVDVQPLQQAARDEAERRGLTAARFVTGTSESLDDASFDVVISHDSFEHFADPAAVLAEMVRLTRVGGSLWIKFGPPWRNPHGRHMFGTLRKDRPWIHLVVPERTIMRVHSAYHGLSELRERYDQLPGGLNRMTLGRFRALLSAREDLELETFRVFPLYGLRAVHALPEVLQEFVAGGVMARARCVR